MSEKKHLSAKQYLKQLEIIEAKIIQNLERLDEMKADAIDIGGIDYSRERVQTSKSGGKVCDDVTRYISYGDKIDTETDSFINATNQIIREIRGLNDKNYINVLYKIYVQYKSVKITAREMKMSYQYVVELHRKALNAFEATYKNLYYLT